MCVDFNSWGAVQLQREAEMEARRLEVLAAVESLQQVGVSNSIIVCPDIPPTPTPSQLASWVCRRGTSCSTIYRIFDHDEMY